MISCLQLFARLELKLKCTIVRQFTVRPHFYILYTFILLNSCNDVSGIVKRWNIFIYMRCLRTSKTRFSLSSRIRFSLLPTELFKNVKKSNSSLSPVYYRLEHLGWLCTFLSQKLTYDTLHKRTGFGQQQGSSVEHLRTEIFDQKRTKPNGHRQQSNRLVRSTLSSSFSFLDLSSAWTENSKYLYTFLCLFTNHRIELCYSL